MSIEFHLLFKRVTWHFPLTRHLENSLFLDVSYAQAQMDFLDGKLFILDKGRGCPRGGGGGGEISEELEKKLALLVCLQILADDDGTLLNRPGESNRKRTTGEIALCN